MAKIDSTIEKKIAEIVKAITDRLINDDAVPRNIKRSAADAVKSLQNTEKDYDIRISGATSILSEITSENNFQGSWIVVMPILSDLETLLIEADKI